MNDLHSFVFEGGFMLKIEEKIKEILEPILKDEGVLLKEIRFFHDNDANILEIGVQMINGETDLQAIETISPFISDWLDKIDLMEDAYFLDVYAVTAK